MADRNANVLTVACAVLMMTASLAYCTFGAHADDVDTTPSDTCKYRVLEEARITEELDREPDRLWWKVQGDYLAVFIWNMKWAFDITVDADTLYIIEALTPGSNVKHVHMFTVRNHCITRYALTWGAVVAEMLRPDAWERGNPHVDGQTDRPVPAFRPAAPAMPPPPVPTGTPPTFPPGS